MESISKNKISRRFYRSYYHSPSFSSRNLQKILSRKFAYLGKGGDMFVFQDVRAEYVLKFFKTPRLAMEQFQRWGLSSLLGNNKRAMMASSRKMQKNSRRGYCIADKQIRSLCGLVYVHLSPVKIARGYTKIAGNKFALNNYPFVIQLATTTLRDKIDALAERGQRQACKRVIDDVLDFIARVWKKGFTEQTFNIDNNYGYTLSKKLVLIDPTDIVQGREAILKEITKKQILRQPSVRKWLQPKCPDLFAYLRKKVMQQFPKIQHGLRNSFEVTNTVKSH